MEELAKTAIVNIVNKLSSTELLILSIVIIIFGAVFGTLIFAISRGVTDIFGKKFLDYKNNVKNNTSE